MKRLMLWGMMACGFLSHVMGQKISPVITLQDGRIVTPEYAFLDGDTCTFHLNRINEKYKWSFELSESQSATSPQILQTDEPTETFTIHADLIDWYYAKEYEEKGDSSVYFKGIVSIWDGQTKKDSITIRFNLLPSRPKIVGASFIYTHYNWEYDDFYQTAEISIYFRTERSDECFLRTGDPFYFDFPKGFYFRSGYDFIPYKTDDGTFVFRTNDADWGQFYRLSAGNKYGGVASRDTLFSTDYIHDPEILARLEEIEKNLSSVPTLTDGNDIRILNAGHHIKIEGDQSLVREISIYNHTGILIKNQHGGEDMDISDLPQGIYIVTCRTEDNRLLTKKIMKS